MSNELTLPEGLCTFSRGSLTFTRTPTYEEWQQIGRYLTAARRSSLRWIASWRSTGRRNFGDAAVEETEAQLQLEFNDVKALESLERLESGVVDAPSDEHAYVAARLCDTDDEASEWLRTATEENLTAHELQKSIKAGEVVRDEEKKPGGGSTGVLTLDAIALDFQRWLSRVERDKPFDQWHEKQLNMVKWQLKPLAFVFMDCAVRARNTSFAAELLLDVLTGADVDGCLKASVEVLQERMEALRPVHELFLDIRSELAMRGVQQ